MPHHEYIECYTDSGWPLSRALKGHKEDSDVNTLELCTSVCLNQDRGKQSWPSASIARAPGLWQPDNFSCVMKICLLVINSFYYVGERQTIIQVPNVPACIVTGSAQLAFTLYVVASVHELGCHHTRPKCGDNSAKMCDSKCSGTIRTWCVLFKSVGTALFLQGWGYIHVSSKIWSYLLFRVRLA